MAWNWSNFGQGAAGGAATGTALLPGWGTAIGAVLGGLAGGLSGEDNQDIPSFDAAERAREFLRAYGGIGESMGAVSGSAGALGRRTAADLISSGVDPVSAQNIASRRQQMAQEQGVSDVISSTRQMEAQLAGQLMPYEIQREEDQISLRNLRANEPSVFESFIPLMMSAAYTRMGQGGSGQASFPNGAQFASTMLPLML